jgi:AAA+ ATPase superfamily predicted ATPase
VSESLPPGLIKEMLEASSKLSSVPPFKAEYYMYANKLKFFISYAKHLTNMEYRKKGLKKDLPDIDVVFGNIEKYLSNLIKNFNLASFFSITPKPRFGLKVNRKQPLKFIVRNISDVELSNIKLDIQSSAEMEIAETGPFGGSEKYKPGEQRELNTLVIPRVVRQIAISFKINDRFCEPIYVSAERDNPFIPNQPAHHAHFVGREHELQSILEEIHQQHFLLFGPRRIGKTSILYQLREELKGGYIPIYISLQKLTARNGALLFDELISAVIRELQDFKIFSTTVPDSTDQSIQGIVNSLQDKRLTLLVDEMDVGKERVENFPVFLERMRAIIQQIPCIRIVFSSGPFITKALVDPKSPLYNMVSHIPVNRFTPGAGEKLIRLAEDKDIVFEENTIAECLQWSGNLPLYLQILGDRLYRIFKDKDNSERRVTQTILTRVKEDMINDNLEWEKLWNMLETTEEKTIIAILAHEGCAMAVPDVKNNIERLSGKRFSFARIKESLNNLVWHGLLDNKDGIYTLTTGLVRDWLTTQLYYPEEIQDLFYFANNNHENITRKAENTAQLL